MARLRDIEVPDEQALLREARALMPALEPVEPRAGFAARVALAARDERRPLFAWMRWSVGGLAVACTAAVALVALAPRGAPAPSHGEELVLAQRLDLFEDLDVVQHQEALEDLEVVSVLHTLEARP